MFTTNFTKPNTLDLSLPAKVDKPIFEDIDVKNSITFIIGKNNRLFYHQVEQKDLKASSLKEISFSNSEFSQIIEVAKKNAPKPEIFTVIVKPMDDANYKNFVDVLDEMAICNFYYFLSQIHHSVNNAGYEERRSALINYIWKEQNKISDKYETFLP